MANFYTQAKAGSLPAVSWVVPSGAVSEHPPATTSAGQAYVTSLINAVMTGPDWGSTAIFLAWDDWGGFYDHVVAPRVDENSYGLRVPGLVISPYAKRGSIDHQTLSFDAYAKFIEDVFLDGQRLDPRPTAARTRARTYGRAPNNWATSPAPSTSTSHRAHHSRCRCTHRPGRHRSPADRPPPSWKDGGMRTPRITAAMCARGRVVAEPRLAPDGTRVAFLANSAVRGQVTVVPVDGGPETVVTTDPAASPAAAYGGGAFDWAPDGTALVYAATDGRLYHVGAAGGPPRALVEQGPCAAPAVSPDGGRVAYVVDTHHVAVAAVGENGPWPVRLSGGADFCLDPAWSPDGRLVAWHEWDVPAMPWDSSRTVLRPADGSGGPVVVAGGDGVSTAQPRFSPDGSALAFLCDAEGWLNLWVADADGRGARPLLKEEHEHGDPTWGPGQRSFAWSPDGKRLAFCRNEGGFGSLGSLDLATGDVAELSRGVHGGLSWAGERLVCVRSGARTPTSVVAIGTGAQGAVATTVLARGPVGGFEDAGLVEPEVVHWPADDGAEVHGRLYRPAAPPEGLARPPLLVWVHGGPTGQWPVTFNPRIAYFVDRGWAVLVPDHRGSTGWGRDYAQAMAGRWGDLDVSDTAAGMRAAADRGWCDGRRMVPIGGSAGGFTVLLLLALHPDLCAAGVDLFGVADLFDLDETTHRFEKHYLHSIVGPLPETSDRYRERSPLNLAERIESPLLVLQGTDDKVVPPAQSQAIADRLRALGRTVELHLYEGEGHGWLRPESIEDELTRSESFLRRHVLRWRSSP